MKDSLWIFLLATPLFGFMVTFVGRKISADFQARVGPKEAGANGFNQVFADALKLIQKNAIHLGAADFVFLGLFFSFSVALFALVPLSDGAWIVRSDLNVLMAILLFFFNAFLYFILCASSSLFEESIGGIRLFIQSLSGLVMALPPLLFVAMGAGGLDWSHVVAQQNGNLFKWNIFSAPPFGFLAFLFFFVSGLLIAGLKPFEKAFESQELRGAFFSRLSGYPLLMMMSTRFLLLFFWCAMTALLFLGGFSAPTGSVGMGPFGDLGILLIKIFILISLLNWVDIVTPRLRSDQVTDLVWKFGAPWSFIFAVAMVLYTWAGGR